MAVRILKIFQLFRTTKNDHLTNVVNFRFIQTLRLKECRNLVDVSSLRGVYDFSCKMYGSKRYFFFRRSSSLRNFEFQSNADRLSCFTGDPNSEAHLLYYFGCFSLEQCKDCLLEEWNNLADVSSLRGVRDLTLLSCSKIEDISMLTTVQKLTLNSLSKLKNYEGINQMMKDLTFQPSDLNDGLLSYLLERFPNVKKIECSFALLLYKLIFPLLSSFTLCMASPVVIEVCLDIQTVILESSVVKSISGLKKNRVVRLVQCRGEVVDVSSLATVPLVSIIKCQFKEVNYESLMNVPRLKIEKEQIVRYSLMSVVIGQTV